MRNRELRRWRSLVIIGRAKFPTYLCSSISSQPVAGEQEKAVNLRLRGVAVWGTMTREKHLTSTVGTGHSGGPLSLLSAGKEAPTGIDQTSA